MIELVRGPLYILLGNVLTLNGTLSDKNWPELTDPNASHATLGPMR